jgi:hypothetical protein
MLVVIWVAVAILVGIYAQKGRGRTGAVWGFFTAIAFAVVWLMTNSVVSSDPHLAFTPDRDLVTVLTAAVLAGPAMLAIVWTLPLKPSGERLTDHYRPRATPEIALTPSQLACIGPTEAQLIRATLRRIPSLSEEHGIALLNEVAETMRIRLQLAELPSSDPMTFLRDLLTLAERKPI